MKILVAAFITAMLVFVLATAWTEVVQPRSNTASSAPPAAVKEPAGKRSSRASSVTVDDELDDDELSLTTRRNRRMRAEDELNDLTKERLLAQFEEVKRKEAKLLEREEALKSISAEIRREIAEVDEIRRQSARELAMVERSLMDEISNSARPTRQVTVPSETPVTSEKPKANADARIAGFIQDLVNRGNINDAATVLGGFKERDIARILGSLQTSNPGVATRLAEQIRLAKLQAARPVDNPQ